MGNLHSYLQMGNRPKKSYYKSHVIKSRDFFFNDAFSTEIWNFVETWPIYFLKYICAG